MRAPNTVVFCAIDNLIGATGKALTGFPAFLEGLEDARVPFVPVTTRSRMQFDASLRKFGLGHPFIAEGGCGVYLPEDYFHLKPPRSMRLGRFTCIPVASPSPAAAEMLDTLSEETGVEVVALRRLSPRELSQNAGLPQREAELIRQRDFDELFFFAGSSEADVEKFRQESGSYKAQVRPRGALWSLAVGASLLACVRELSQLYQRSLRAAPSRIGIATAEEAGELCAICDRCLLLTTRDAETPTVTRKCRALPLFGTGTWPTALEAILSRQL